MPCQVIGGHTIICRVQSGKRCWLNSTPDAVAIVYVGQRMIYFRHETGMVER